MANRVKQQQDELLQERYEEIVVPAALLQLRDVCRIGSGWWQVAGWDMEYTPTATGGEDTVLSIDWLGENDDDQRTPQRRTTHPPVWVPVTVLRPRRTGDVG